MRLLRIALLTTMTLSLSSTWAAEQFWTKWRRNKVETVELPDSTYIKDSISKINLIPLVVEVPAEKPTAEEQLINDSITLEYTMVQMDSLLGVWRERRANDHFDEFRQHYIIADSLFEATSVPDSVYAERLRKLASPVNLPFNDVTKSYITRYTNTRYGTINRILSLA